MAFGTGTGPDGTDKPAGVELVVHTIGFKVQAKARSELSWVSAATGGSYREVSSGADLVRALTSRVQRAIHPYVAVGRRSAAAPRPPRPPPSGRASTWTPTSRAPQEARRARSSTRGAARPQTRYYKVRLGWGQRLAYRIGIPSQPALGLQSGNLNATIASPLRQRPRRLRRPRRHRGRGGRLAGGRLRRVPRVVAAGGATALAVAVLAVVLLLRRRGGRTA